VLENLDRYLANQGRSRGENSRLMKWCHRQILGKLKQLCEPYGLRVLETPAAYSSRFCSLK
jgi:transposase